MKKYRFTKTMVKTTETVSVTQKITSETQPGICPLCQAPLAALQFGTEMVPAAFDPEEAAEAAGTCTETHTEI